MILISDHLLMLIPTNITCFSFYPNIFMHDWLWCYCLVIGVWCIVEYKCLHVVAVRENFFLCFFNNDVCVSLKFTFLLFYVSICLISDSFLCSLFQQLGHMYDHVVFFNLWKPKTLHQMLTKCFFNRFCGGSLVSFGWSSQGTVLGEIIFHLFLLDTWLTYVDGVAISL